MTLVHDALVIANMVTLSLKDNISFRRIGDGVQIVGFLRVKIMVIGEQECSDYHETFVSWGGFFIHASL